MKKNGWVLSFFTAAALLAASRERCHAVVGYVNVAITNGLNFVANPLNTTNNTLTNLVFAPDATMVWEWDVQNQTFGAPILHAGGSWESNLDLPLGKGFVLYSPSQWTNTFVGEVLEGSLTNFIAGNNKLSLVASLVPQSGAISGILEFPATDGDTAYVFRETSQSYLDAFSFFGGSGWFDPNSVSGTNGPVVNVAQPFFVQHPGPDTNWVRNFTVQFAPNSKSRADAGKSAALKISNIKISGGKKIMLTVVNPDGGSYDVQFSTDRSSWKTVAASQTGAIWTGTLPPGDRGYYQVIKH